MASISSFIKKHALGRYLNASVIAAIDVLIATASTVVALISVNLAISNIEITLKQGLLITLCTIVASIIATLITRSHHIIIRHSTLSDVWKFVVAVAIKEVLIALPVFLLIPKSEMILFIALDTLVVFASLVCVRIAMILVYNRLKQSIISFSKRSSVFVYGIGDKSSALKIRLDNSTHYNVLGFIDFVNREKHNTLMGLPVHSFSGRSNEEVQQFFHDHDASAVVFPNYDTLKEERERLVEICTSHRIKVLVAGPIDEAIDGRQSLVREIKIEDLLGRDEIKISMNEIINNFKGKRILVTGAAGSIGSELCRQLATFGIDKLIMFDNAETPLHNIRLELEGKHPDLALIPIIGDVRQEARLEYIFSIHKPQVVFHAAAYKHVPLMEENPCEAVYVNVIGSRNIANKCVEHGAEMMVMISTDKAVNPTNIMGCSKRLAEIYVQSLGRGLSNGTIKPNSPTMTKFVTTRFGNVLGSNGSVIPRFREQILNGGPITVTHPEITRFFMTIPEACRLVMEAATMGGGNQIFVFDMGKSVKIVDLARRMIELAGLEVDKDIKIEFTGLRPGEKLYEEVLANAENTIATPHDKICIAKVRDYNFDEITNIVEQLGQLANDVKIIELVKLMKTTVPEFKSQNSHFAELDKNE